MQVVAVVAHFSETTKFVVVRISTELFHLVQVHQDLPYGPISIALS